VVIPQKVGRDASLFALPRASASLPSMTCMGHACHAECSEASRVTLMWEYSKAGDGYL